MKGSKGNDCREHECQLKASDGCASELAHKRLIQPIAGVDVQTPEIPREMKESPTLRLTCGNLLFFGLF